MRLGERFFIHKLVPRPLVQGKQAGQAAPSRAEPSFNCPANKVSQYPHCVEDMDRNP